VEYAIKQPVYDDLKPVPEFFRFKPNYLLHENEYRIIDYLRNCTPQKDEKGPTMFFRSLPRKCVKAIYLGHRIEKSVREEILQLLRGLDIRKFDTIPSQEDYTHSFREIKS
jgi:hypothetical protein